MNKTISRLSLYLLCLLSSVLAVSCSSEVDDVASLNDHRLPVQVKVDARCSAFRNVTTRSAAGWEDNDIIFLILNTPSGVQVYYAIYHADEQGWGLHSDGTISQPYTGVLNDVTAFYIQHTPEAGSKYALPLYHKSEVYKDAKAYYSYDGGDDLILQVTLSPYSSRVRFKGTSGATFSVTGLRSFTDITFAEGEPNTTDKALELSVLGDGYSDYCYVNFSEPSTRKLTVVMDGVTYTATFPASAMQMGHSGCITLPSSTSLNGWTRPQNDDITIDGDDYDSDTDFTPEEQEPTIDTDIDGGDYGEDENWNPKEPEPTVDTDIDGGDYSEDEDWNPAATFDTKQKVVQVGGCAFNLVPVQHGTFTMGATSEQADYAFDREKPAHAVTLTKDYYIGETEVTQQLWYAVMGQKPTASGSQWVSTYGLGNDYPAYYLTYTDVLTFITRLNNQTGEHFRLPTEAEWEFAARGGNLSKGYIYSGSNSMQEVGWYADNSGNKTHPVKQLAPNELGIYDMSGNVYEWVADYYADYSGSSLTDPTGAASGDRYVERGGSYRADAIVCRVSHRLYMDPAASYNYLGFRLACDK